MNKESEFENFDRTMRDLMKVSHDDIKAELDKEKTKKIEKKNDKRNKSSNRTEGCAGN